MVFDERPPSTAWEQVLLSSDPPAVGWAWFKPPHAPNSIALQLAPELWRDPTVAAGLTIRDLAAATEVDELLGWTAYGHYHPVNAQTAAFLDALLPPPPADGDPLIVLWCPVPPPPPAAPVVGDWQPGEDPVPLLKAIDSHWSALQPVEADIRRVRMQLEQMHGRLSSLNRDLNTDEALAADNSDKKAWQDARRWLRDSAAVVNRSMKEIDTGTLSGAGQRHRFEDIYRQYVEPRIPFAGLKQAAIDFEMHLKTAKNTLQAAQAAISKGTSDGERRANAVLQRIAGKVREQRNQSRRR